MPHDRVRAAYRARAVEYAAALGSMHTVHPSDRVLVESWAAGLSGHVIDAGCGPGHWSGFLQECGVDVTGLDLVPEFVELASKNHPTVPFWDGSLVALPVADGALGGILSWYSLIHLTPDEVEAALIEFARCLRPGGSVLLGFFDGAKVEVEAFDHAIVTAYRWPAKVLAQKLEAVGFDIVETHTRTGATSRPHAAIVARRAERVGLLLA